MPHLRPVILLSLLLLLPGVFAAATAGSPVISALNRDAAASGSMLVAIGSGLDAADSICFVGADACLPGRVMLRPDGNVATYVPSSLTPGESYRVRITTPAGVAESEAAFALMTVAPVLFAPSAGFAVAGGAVRYNGYGLAGADGMCLIPVEDADACHTATFSPTDTPALLLTVPSDLPVCAEYAARVTTPAGQSTTNSLLVVSGATPCPPQDLRASRGGIQTLDQIRLDWAAPVAPAEADLVEYRVYRQVGAEAWSQVAAVRADTRDWTDYAAPVFEPARYYVAAVSAAGEGTASNQVCKAGYPAAFTPELSFGAC